MARKLSAESAAVKILAEIAENGGGDRNLVDAVVALHPEWEAGAVLVRGAYGDDPVLTNPKPRPAGSGSARLTR